MSQFELDGHTCSLHVRLACWHSAQDVGQPTYALQPSQHLKVLRIEVITAETGQELAGSLGFFSFMIQER